MLFKQIGVIADTEHYYIVLRSGLRQYQSKGSVRKTNAMRRSISSLTAGGATIAVKPIGLGNAMQT
ncbi:hypothetical protein PG995_004796 [Apiospora arundinis]